MCADDNRSIFVQEYVDIMKHKDIHLASEVGMYQVHGNHIDTVVDTATPIGNYIRKILSDSKVLEWAKSEVDFEGRFVTNTDVCSLLYGEKDFGFISLIAYDPDNNANQFMSTFPFYLAKTIHVRIEKVWVWDNLIEATVECSYKGFTFCFFAVDYFAHKDDYLPGVDLDIRIGALGMHVEESEHGFSFEGQKAIDWLAKIGEKPEYDENGEVRPVNFSLEELVTCFPADDKCPDEAVFQSPAGEMKERHFMDLDFYETGIFLHRHEFEFSVPFIFRKDFLPEARKDTPLRGSLWVVGSM